MDGILDYNVVSYELKKLERCEEAFLRRLMQESYAGV